ncbi:protein kinase [Lentisphaera marina]|uniref:protein kinase domain-containing protein n=1 Tax=Lentisphaera marina TaxID=1111041 RepID=UPI002365434D|nr:protein kinase [Lentisphaera marina]MDD7984134.1 protein kinase [Lentisphaera marina]
MDLEGTIHVDRFKCVKCGADIELRPGRMEEGVRIAGKYQTLYKTNDDGYSSTYICKDLNDDELRLLRIYDKTLTDLISNPKEFIELVGAVSFMAGENHMLIIDTGLSDKYLYQVMPFRKLESIEQLVAYGYIWAPDQALDLIYELVKSLEEGVAKIGTGHFNLNPNNIFISNKGKVRYQGFGIAPQLLSEKSFAKSELHFFDVYYLSPEVARGKGYPTQASDIYSLGMILYYMIAGTTPCVSSDGEDVDYQNLVFPQAVEAEIDEGFFKIFKSITENDPANRPQSFKEFRQQLENYFSAKNHQNLNQMEGEKTDLYKKDLYKKKVINLLNPLGDYKSKNLNAPMSANAVRRRMLTQTALDIPIDLSEKLNDKKRVKRRRIKAHVSPTKIDHRNVRVQNQANEKSQAPLFMGVFIVLAISLSWLIFANMPEEKQVAPLIVENEKALVIEKNQNKELERTINASKKQLEFKLNEQFYLIEMRKSEPDFDKLDKQLLQDLDQANNNQKVKLQKIAKAINKAKLAEQRRIVINLKSEVGTAVFNREYNKALEIYTNYKGPFALETLKIREKLAAELKNIIKQKELTAKHSQDLAQSLIEVALREKLTAVVENLFAKEYKLASAGVKELLPLYDSVDLLNFSKLIEKSSIEAINTEIMTTLATQDEVLVSVSFNGSDFKASVVSCDLDNLTVEVNLNYSKGVIKKTYSIDELKGEELQKWIAYGEDESTKAFLTTIFHIYRDDLITADKSLETYRKSYGDILNLELKERLANLANEEMERLFKVYNYPYLSNQAKSLVNDDLIAFSHQLRQLIELYSSRVNLKGGNEYYVNLLNQFDKFTERDGSEEIFINNSHSNLYFNKQLSERYNTVRVLPGDYVGDLKIEGRKVNLIGTKNVTIKGNLIVSSSNIQIKNITLIGRVLIYDKGSHVNINNCMIKGPLIASKEGDNINISNSILSGIRGAKNKNIHVENSILKKPIYDLRCVINGNADYEFVNCIIYSSGALIHFNRESNKGDYKNCLLYAPGAISVGHKGSTYSLDEADGKVGNFSKCILAKPKFKNVSKGDFTLLELSAGYLKGSDKKSIGVRMNEDLDLR